MAACKGIELSQKRLKEFWPCRGPQWNALGRFGDKAYFLVEAKAHVSEIISSFQAKAPASKVLIEKSLNTTRVYLKLKDHLQIS